MLKAKQLCSLIFFFKKSKILFKKIKKCKKKKINIFINGKKKKFKLLQ